MIDTLTQNTRAAAIVDRGADGPAMLARRAIMTVIEDDTAAEDGTRRFTRTEVLRTRDTVIDQYAEAGVLVGRRLDAAIELARLYEAGRVAPTGWRVSGGHGGGEMSDDRAAAWEEYSAALEAMPKRCQSACADVARDMFPGDLRAAENMRDGFAALADLWRMQGA